MIHIVEIQPLPDAQMLLRFDDGTDKLVDVRPFIGTDVLTAPLADPSYFKRVALYPNGRGIFWPNDYDMCPDYLRHYAPDARITCQQPAAKPIQPRSGASVTSVKSV